MFQYESIQHYHSELQNGKTSCVKAVEYYLNEIDQKKYLNAFVRVYADEALHKAREMDHSRKAGASIGKLHGVVVALKDVICYKGHPISASSQILKDFTSIYNATVVDKLLREEAIIIGHTNCDEFAMGSTNENSAYGRVLNALDNNKVPGGSSGGSAVAVQAGLSMVSLGSDTGGSVRQPADFCGIVGLKPTYGRVSRHGLIAYASSFDQIGIFGKNIPDVSIVLEVISGSDKFDGTCSDKDVEEYTKLAASAPKPLRIAYFKEVFESAALDKEIATRLTSFIREQESLGHYVQGLEFEYLDFIVPAYYILTTAEASSNLARFDGVKYGFRNGDKKSDLADFYSLTRSQGFGKEVKRRIMLGTFVLSAGYYDAYFTKAQQVRKSLVEKTKLIFKEFDLLIMPTAPSTAFNLNEKLNDPISMYLADIFTVFSNLTGVPSISIPLFWHSNGLPFGLQAMTSDFCELSLLRVSHQWMNTIKSPTF